jgi:hypothetical protein
MIIRILYWLPRFLAISAILFMLMFSLDVFEGPSTPCEMITGFLVHNIPTFMLLAALIIAWKSERIGGLILILLFFGLGIIFKSYTSNPASLIILFPVLLAGIMFILHSWLSDKKSIESKG